MTKINNIDEYISGFAGDIRTRLTDIRNALKNAVPEAEEKMSYGLPTLTFHGVLLHYGGFKDHIGLYALPSGNSQFREALSVYKTGKGSVQFPHSEPLPVDLIRAIAEFRARENLAKAKKK